MMTKDNYEEIKIKILEIIKNEVENKNKLLDIIFLKSCQEESFVGIYAQLCKYLNKELPQKIQKKTMILLIMKSIVNYQLKYLEIIQ